MALACVRALSFASPRLPGIIDSGLATVGVHFAGVLGSSRA